MKFSNKRLDPGTRIALRVEYDGRVFNGWQAQTKLDVPTVQETLETALGVIGNQQIRTWCAGRTDKGVHASGQIVHFEDPIGRSLKSWVFGVNSQLPDAVSVHWAGSVSSEFHARFSAVSRRYQYIIANAPTRSAQLSGLVTWYRRPLSAGAMHQCAQLLVGEHDFSAFRAASCQSTSPWRHLFKISVSRQNDFVIVDLEANAFLHHMVRNIVGSLMLVGTGLKTQKWFEQVFFGKDRTQSGDTANSAGLYLVSVGYPEDCGIPAGPRAPTLLSHSV
ncbi:MAG: tRNA pseudouridine(38-40) synthase TruA [Pseudomonadota bacterium]|nr:tRNA pseudouridine(38-40) synthase TruA [Pseudomonadota bacterium]